MCSLIEALIVSALFGSWCDMEPTEEEGGTTAHHPERGAVGEKLRKVTVVLRRCDQEEEEEEEQDGKRLGKGKSCQKYGENTLHIVPLPWHL